MVQIIVITIRKLWMLPSKDMGIFHYMTVHVTSVCVYSGPYVRVQNRNFDYTIY